MIPKFVVNLTSGGLDSITALYWLKTQNCRVHSLGFYYGQNHKKELAFAKLHSQRLNVPYTEISIPQLRGSSLTDGSGSFIVPNRNAIFLSIAANFAAAAGADSITIGVNKTDETLFPDCRMAFIQTFNNMLTTSGVPVEVCAPFIDKSKAWIAALAAELKVKRNETWSCYAGGMEPCGVCVACQALEEALR